MKFISTSEVQRHINFLIYGEAGVGKAQPHSSKVLTPDGYIPMGDIVKGDTVIGKDGLYKKVQGTYPQGMKRSYKVVFRDGTYAMCSKEHLWGIRHVNSHTGERSLKIMTCGDMRSIGVETPGGNKRFSIPLTSPIQYPEKEYYIHPYVLGALIGDGTSLGRTPTLCNIDPFVVSKVISLLPDGIKPKYRSTEGCVYHTLTYPAVYHANILADEFRRLNLGVKSPKRFIPDEYMNGSIEQRRDLLHGLMDTDGSSKKNRIGFSTRSKRLAHDIAELNRTLGGTSIVRKHNRGKGDEYVVNIKSFTNPFSFPDKADNWRLSSKNPPSRYIWRIEKQDKEEHSCISVEGAYYLTDKCIVTHNTSIISTAPNPFIISSEAGLLSLSGHDIPAVEINNRNDCNEVYEWLIKSKEAEQYETICLDSLSEIAEVLLLDEKKANKDGRAAYGVMADEMITLIRGFRDLKKHVYFACKLKRLTDDSTGRVSFTPSVPGQVLLQGLPHFFDELFAMRHGKSETGSYRYLQTVGDMQFPCKDRSGCLEDKIKPDLTEIIECIKAGNRIDR